MTMNRVGEPVAPVQDHRQSSGRAARPVGVPSPFVLPPPDRVARVSALPDDPISCHVLPMPCPFHRELAASLASLMMLLLNLLYASVTACRVFYCWSQHFCSLAFAGEIDQENWAMKMRRGQQHMAVVASPVVVEVAEREEVTKSPQGLAVSAVPPVNWNLKFAKKNDEFYL